jgi:hypothetical protein
VSGYSLPSRNNCRMADLEKGAKSPQSLPVQGGDPCSSLEVCARKPHPITLLNRCRQSEGENTMAGGHVNSMWCDKAILIAAVCISHTFQCLFLLLRLAPALLCCTSVWRTSHQAEEPLVLTAVALAAAGHNHSCCCCCARYLHA